MTASTIDTLIRQAKDGNDDSWIAVIASAHDEIALAIACYATSRAMYDEAIKSTWIACRSTLSQFPASGSARAWLRAVALNNIRQALERELQPGADGLSQALASPALRAVLAVGDGSGEPQADMLRQQILTLSADQQAVLTRRYRDRIELTALAQELSKESHVVAGTLFTARAAADWSKASSSVTDGLFPVLIEDFINGSISVDSRGVLVGCVGKDPNRGLQVARQLRMALLLGAVLHPAEQAEVLSLAQVGMRKRGDTATTGPKTSRVATRRHSSTLRRAASEEDLSENPDGPDPAKGKRLTFALVLVGAMILICVISLAVIWRSPAQSALQQAPAPVAGGATAGSLMAQAGGPRNAIGRIVRHHAGAFVVEAANRIACDDERSLLSGEGLETGADGELQVQYGDHTHVTLGGDTVVSSVSAGAERDPVQIHVQQGNLSVTSSGRQVTVFTATARVELTSGQCTLVATPSATTLDVRHGDVRLSRADGSHGLAMTSDQRASIIDHDGPTLVKSGGFILGINLGGDEVVIHKNQWLSGKMAVLTGLAVAAGTEVAPPIAISAVGLDFDTKAMLGSGLISPAGPVQVSQRAPSGDYDLWLWISGAEGVSSTGVALRLQGHAVEIGAPSERADTWWRLGPYRVTSQSGSIDLAIDGLSRMRLSGLEIDSVDGSSIPAGVALTSPSADSRWYSNQPIRLAVEILGMSDSLSKIQYFDGETMVGESSKAPFAATCTVAPGEHRFSAKTVPRAGAPIESNAVTLRILPAFGEGSIGADMYQGIPGEPVRDLTANAAFPDHPSSHRVLTDFEQRKLGFNYGTRVRGYVSAPIDGAYEFRVSADDTAELWLSTDAQEAGKRRLAFCPSHVGFREWGKYPEQHSQPITLELQGSATTSRCCTSRGPPTTGYRSAGSCPMASSNAPYRACT
jgi:DNA-directed RNA polymerase specialized sigma24 family protein